MHPCATEPRSPQRPRTPAKKRLSSDDFLAAPEVCAMSDDQKKAEEDGIYRLDTVPPPMGESDAYSAPTKVGPMAAAAVEELMKAAEQRASDLSARSAERRKLSAATAATGKAPSASPPSSARAGRPSGEPALTSETNEARANALPSERSGSSGRPAPAIGGAPASVPAKPASAAKPARRPAPPVPTPAPAPPPKPAFAAPPAAPPKEAQAAQSAAVPRLYDESLDEEFDGEYAETLLHKNAQPPVVSSAAAPPMQPQLHTQPMDASLVSSVVESVNARGAITPQRVSAAPAATPSYQPPAATPSYQPPVVRAPEPMKLWPLVIGMVIFAIGLTCYLFVR
jgi:hypothetical protein